MKNSESLMDEVSSVIENAMAVSNGEAVSSATKIIDDAFLLIPKGELPTLYFGSIDDAFSGDPAQTVNLTEKAFNGDFKKMRDLGLQYLVMADYVERKVIKEQVDSAKLRRYKVFKELYPDEYTADLDDFTWEGLTSFERMVIDKMVLMHIELDKDF